MKINLQTSLHNQEFQPMSVRKENQAGGNTTIPVTVGMVAINSLLADQQVKDALEMRLKRYELAARINEAGNVIELSKEEAALIMLCVEQWQPTNLLAQMYKIFNSALTAA